MKVSHVFQKNALRFLSFIIISSTWIYLLPILFYLEFQIVYVNSAFINTLIFSAVTTFISVLFGFIVSLILFNSNLSPKLELFISFLLFPFFLGTISSSYLFKLLSFNSEFIQNLIETRNYFSVLFTLVSIHLWKYGLLFSYLFWFGLKALPKNIVNFCKVTFDNLDEKIKNIFWPQSKNLVCILIIFGLFLNFHEYRTSELTLKPNKATKTEFISHELHREYFSIIGESDVEQANDYVLKKSFLFMKLIILFVVISLLLIILLYKISLLVFTTVSKLVYPRIKKKQFSLGLKILKCLSYMIIASSFLPIILSIPHLNFSKITFSPKFGLTVIYSSIASLLTLLLAGMLANSLKISFPNLFRCFQFKSLGMFLPLLLLYSVPSIGIAICGYKWLSYLNYNSIVLSIVLWIIGQIILTLPLITIFLIWLNYRVKNEEIEYQISLNISILDITKTSFISRFKLEYLFSFIFSFILIFNEDTFNLIMSDYVPAIADRLGSAISSRAASNSEATSIILLAILLSISCVVLWNLIQINSKRTRKIS